MTKQTSTLGEYLNQHRLSKKTTFAELSKTCKMATPTIWKVVKNKARPKDLTLQALSESLDVPLQELFRLRDKTKYSAARRKPKKTRQEQQLQKPIDKHVLVEEIQKVKLSEDVVESLYHLVHSLR